MGIYYTIVGLFVGFLSAYSVLSMIYTKKEKQEFDDMVCPKCEGEARVVDTVKTPENEVYRRRKCVKCDHGFYTVEFEADVTDKFRSEWTEHHRLHIWRGE